jgi:preprotein translocase subunit SecE
VAKTSPGEFVRQVRLEAVQRVHWPTMKETWVTAVMVFLLTSLLALFFFGVDAVFSSLVKFLLGLLAK